MDKQEPLPMQGGGSGSFAGIFWAEKGPQDRK